MDPVSLLVAALAAGASAALQDTVSQAVKDAYGQGLKSLLKRKLGGDKPLAQAVIERHEEGAGGLGEAAAGGACQDRRRPGRGGDPVRAGAARAG